MKRLYPILALAGAIPFIICALLVAIDITALPYLGQVTDVLSAYGLVIATFMAGSHWGQHLNVSSHWRMTLPLASNGIAILLWLGFLMMTFKPLMMVYAATYLLLLHIDYGLYKAEIITRDYFHIRFIVTGIVVLALVVAGYLA